MHYTVTDGVMYGIPQSHSNTDHVQQQNINLADPSSLAYQYNMGPNVSAGCMSSKGAEFSPRVTHKRAERDEPLEEGLVMHIREAFMPFNDPSPSTRASKRYASSHLYVYSSTYIIPSLLIHIHTFISSITLIYSFYKIGIWCS